MRGDSWNAGDLGIWLDELPDDLLAQALGSHPVAANQNNGNGTRA
jgi:hypothetical protein